MTLNFFIQNLINLSPHHHPALGLQPPRTFRFPLRNPLLLKKQVSLRQLQAPVGPYAAS